MPGNVYSNRYAQAKTDKNATPIRGRRKLSPGVYNSRISCDKNEFINEFNSAPNDNKSKGV